MTSEDREYRNRRSDDGQRSGGRSGDRPRDSRGYRPRDDRRPRDGNRSEGRGYGDRSRGGDRRSGGDRPRDGYRSRDGGRTDRRGPRDDRGHRDDRRSGGYRDRPRDDRREHREEHEERPKLSIPEDITAILHKGVDCEVNGRTDLALILYLHGASKLNGGCENNLLRMLKAAGKDQFSTIRGRMVKDCPAEIIPVFDYLCSTIDAEYDVSGITEAAEKGNINAIHCLIRMGSVEKDSELIDSYAKGLYSMPDVVTKGLEILSRKKDSAKARKYLDDYNDYLTLRKSIPIVFQRSMKGESHAKKELNRLAGRYPEAKFLEGYVAAYNEGTGDEYLKKGMANNMPAILVNLQNIKVTDPIFHKYLKAKKLQSKGEQWIPLMVEAVNGGSDEAMDELYDVRNTWEVRRMLQSYYLAKGDIENLALGYDGKDSTFLDKYCNGEAAKIIEVGKIIGGNREIDWLSKSYKNGCTECRDELIRIADDKFRYGKPLLYALHDTGADKKAADVYFDMERVGDPSLPSVKWLAKVCREEEAKEYVRSKFEAINDLETFEYIFEEDGYVPRKQFQAEKKRNSKRY
ncbi:MAG: hypothetical protein MJZ21_04215 [archaeon]|nr:hypothetical protein [archaeon]